MEVLYSGLSAFGIISSNGRYYKFYPNGTIEDCSEQDLKLLRGSDLIIRSHSNCKNLEKITEKAAKELSVECDVLAAVSASNVVLDSRIKLDKRTKLAEDLEPFLSNDKVLEAVFSLFASSPLADYDIRALKENGKLWKVIEMTELKQDEVVCCYSGWEDTIVNNKVSPELEGAIKLAFIRQGVFSELVHKDIASATKCFDGIFSDVERWCKSIDENFSPKLFFSEWISHVETIIHYKECLVDRKPIMKIAKDPDWEREKDRIYSGANGDTVRFLERAFNSDGCVNAVPKSSPITLVQNVMVLSNRAYCDACIFNQNYIRAIVYAVHAPIEFSETSVEDPFTAHVRTLASAGVKIAYLVEDRKARTQHYKTWKDHILCAQRSDVVGIDNIIEQSIVAANVACFPPGSPVSDNVGFIFCNAGLNYPLVFRAHVDERDNTKSLIALTKLSGLREWKEVQGSLLSGLNLTAKNNPESAAIPAGYKFLLDAGLVEKTQIPKHEDEEKPTDMAHIDNLAELRYIREV